MSPEHLTAVLDHTPKGGSHLLLLLVIAIHADDRGEWTADQPTLQRRAHLSRRRVQQLLGDLVQSRELAVASHHGRGRRSTYRLLVGPEKAQPSAPHRAAHCAFSALSSAAECTLSTQKGEARCTPATTKGAATSAFSIAKGAPGSAFLTPPVPPCPPFPPDPQYPLNPPYPPEKLKQETYGLPPGPTAARQAACSPAKQGKQANSPEPFSPHPARSREAAGRGAGWEKAPGAEPFSPLPFGVGEGRPHGREAGAEGLRPLSAPQSAVFRANLLLEEAAIPLPSPAQICLWAKTLGGIESLLDLLRRLIQAGLATKREPRAYIHRVVLERAAHPEPVPAPAWQPRSRRAPNPLLTAGVDDIRREQALRIIAAAKQGAGW